MTCQEMLEILQDLPDRSIEFVIPVPEGFASACPSNSDIAVASTGEEIFVAMPCSCFDDLDDEIVVAVKAEDFDIHDN